jgi:hypothetical protein
MKYSKQFSFIGVYWVKK